MKNNIVHTRKLDSVLELLNDDGSPIEGVNDIKDKLPAELSNISNKELTLILMKLVKDGYAHNDIQKHTGGGITIDKIGYYISFEGRVFIENGGYIEERYNNKVKKFLRYVQIAALTIFSFATASWAFVQLVDRFSKCCGCHH